MSEHAIREYLKTVGAGGGVSEETDPVFTASPAHGITAQDISDWDGKSDFSGDYNDLTNKPTIPTTPSDIGAQEELVSGTNIKTINGNSILGSGDLAVGGSVTSTDVPTADTISEFDSTAHMNSTDMSAQDVSDFVDGLNVSGTSILDMFYPVGSYYETSDASFNPNTVWGGTWSLETAGKFHVSAGTGYAIGSTGGSASVTLDINQIPNHNHSVGLNTGGSSYGSGFTYATNNSYRQYADGIGEMIGKTGGGQSHENRPPYVAVNRWHRTA